MALVKISENQIIETAGIASITQTMSGDIAIRYQGSDDVTLVRGHSMAEVMAKLAPKRFFGRRR